MEKKNNYEKRIKVNVLSLLAIIYVMFVVINDYLCFFLKVNMKPILYIISFIICILIYIMLHKKIQIEKVDFNKFDIVFWIIIMMVFLARLAIPDSAFDTLNYHIYLQERLFSNNTSYNFFPARWINTFSLPLSDRIHYFFRLILGYKVGLIANLFVLIITFYQVKRILNFYIKNDIYISLISGLIIITEQLLCNMITYYVDLMSIPFFLEIITVMLDSKEKNNLTNYYVLLISGVLVSLKISNAFLLIPIAIIYILKNRKSINYKTFLIGILVFVIPFAVYLINNYIQTGNPVFPFYNSIFKSNYLPFENWIETYYGPKTILERLFWPIYVLDYPNRAFDTNTYYGRISFGYIISLIIILSIIYRKVVKHDKIKSYEYLSILYVVLCLVWSNFMMGYIRYALILEVLSGIVLALYIYKNINTKSIFMFIGALYAIYGFIYTTSASLSDLLYNTNEISWRKTYYLDEENYNENKKYLFEKVGYYDEYLKDVDCFGILDYNAGYAALLSRDIKVIDLNEGYNSEYGKNEFDKVVKSCKSIYTISTTQTIERTNKYLLNSNFERTGDNIVFKVDFINKNNDIIIFEIKERE